MSRYNSILFDAGMFIGALLRDDPRYTEARTIVEAARRGDLSVCTTTGILSEVYAALTWIKAQPPHSPAEAGAAVRLLVEPPSEIEVLSDGLEASLKMLGLSENIDSQPAEYMMRDMQQLRSPAASRKFILTTSRIDSCSNRMGLSLSDRTLAC